MLWIPNFNPEDINIQFFQCWISFPSLPLEYRDPKIVEILANKLGIFLKHDLIPYECLHMEVRVCLLSNMHKLFPKSISLISKWGKWLQSVKVQDSSVIHKLQDKLGHFSLMCQSRQEDGLQVYPDHCSDPNICSQKISLMDCKTSEANKILSMSGDQDDTIDSLHNMHAANRHMPNSFLVYLQ